MFGLSPTTPRFASYRYGHLAALPNSRAEIAERESPGRTVYAAGRLATAAGFPRNLNAVVVVVVIAESLPSGCTAACAPACPGAAATAPRLRARTPSGPMAALGTALICALRRFRCCAR